MPLRNDKKSLDARLPCAGVNLTVMFIVSFVNLYYIHMYNNCV